MSILARLVKLGAHVGQAAAMQRAETEAVAKHRRAARKGDVKGDGLKGCTPCAAKAKGVEMANTIWK